MNKTVKLEHRISKKNFGDIHGPDPEPEAREKSESGKVCDPPKKPDPDLGKARSGPGSGSEFYFKHFKPVANSGKAATKIKQKRAKDCILRLLNDE